MSPDWTAALAALTGRPRENGTDALAETATFLANSLQEAGWQVETLSYVARPLDLRVLGLALLLVGIVYAGGVILRRFGLSLLAALALPLLLAASLDLGLPLAPGLGSREQVDVIATLPGGPEADATAPGLVFTAAFDSQTDRGGMALRRTVVGFAIPVTILMFVIALGSLIAFHADNLTPSRRRIAAGIALVALLFGGTGFVAFGGGMLSGARSRGAFQGAGSAVLLELAREWKTSPPSQVPVTLAFLSGSGIGAQGVAPFVSYLQQKGGAARIVHLGAIGASTDFAVTGREGGFLHGGDPAPEVVALLERAHRQIGGETIPIIPAGGFTDAVRLRQAGLSVATLVTAVPPFVWPHTMGTGEDGPEALQEESLERTRALLRAVVQAADETP